MQTVQKKKLVVPFYKQLRFISMRDKLGVVGLLLVVGIAIGMTSGCATEKPSKLANMDKWQANCANAQIERQLFLKNIMLLEGNRNLEENPVSREKIARLNELLLESDKLCGASGFYTQQS